MNFERVIGEATRVAIERFEADDAINSVTLSDSFEQDHPDFEGAVSDQRLRDYYVDRWLPESLAAAGALLRQMIDDSDDTLPVWRSIVVDGEPGETFQSYVEANGVGLHWSHDRDQAHAHEGTRLFGVECLIEGRVRADAIDWVATIASYGHPDWVGEEEIALNGTAEVRIVSLVRRQGWLTRHSGEEPETEIDIGALSGATVLAGAGAPASCSRSI